MNVNNNKIEALLQCIGNETKNRRQIQTDMREVDGKRFGDWEMDTISTRCKMAVVPLPIFGQNNYYRQWY